MARIDSHDDSLVELEKEVSSLKKQVKKGAAHRVRRLVIKLLIVVAVIALVGGGGAYVLAKAGLPSFPFLTKSLYKDPQPTYFVQPATLDLTKKFTPAMLQQLLKEKKSELAIMLTEGELTSIARDALIAQQDKPVLDSVQVAIINGELEVFAHLVRPQPVFVKLHARPYIDSTSAIRFELSSLSVGQLSLPPSWGTGMVRLTAEPVLNNLLDTFARYGKLTRIDVRDKQLTLYALITAQTL